MSPSEENSNSYNASEFIRYVNGNYNYSIYGMHFNHEQSLMY